ncbi:MAG: hypothetical protein KatS3mg039_0994 [Candidatus Kapaibacterium sp.]|nr:MAG: hypothetical protein KatS3mg039_0994 [Candidatus Kapabacteria bacterium]
MAKKHPTLEEQLRRLEAIRAELERAELPIEDLVKLYEEGIAIAEHVRQRLQTVRQRIITVGKQLGASDQSSSEEDI